MGYYNARIEESRFVVPAGAQPAALQRGLDLSRDELGYDLADRDLQDLDGFLKLFGFDTVRDGEDIVALEFDDKYLIESEEVFRALAPYVEAGSYILLHSGTGARWRHTFDGQAMTRVDEPDAPWYGS